MAHYNNILWDYWLLIVVKFNLNLNVFVIMLCYLSGGTGGHCAHKLPVTVYRSRPCTQYYPGQVLSTTLATTRSQCFWTCMRNDCCSFYHHSQNKTCVTHDTAHPKWILLAKDKWKFYVFDRKHAKH